MGRSGPPITAAIVVWLLLGACSTSSSAPATVVTPGGPRGSATVDRGVPVLPDGWRWEALGGVQVGVPDSWGWGNSSQRLGQWCVEEGPLTPMVGRPGVATAVGCPPARDGGPEPATLIANTGMVVELAWAFDDVDDGAQGDQEIRRIGDVVLRVNAPADLRKRILATVHRTDMDANGCPMQLPPGFEPGSRPQPARDVTALTGVTSLAACRYSILRSQHEGSGDRRPLPLFSSLRLDGATAQTVVAAFAAAPVGGGPDKPDSCLPEHSYGDEMIVTYVESDRSRSTVHVYYSGCDRNGIDDGVTVRALTREAVRPLIADANRPFSWSGSELKRRILAD